MDRTGGIGTSSTGALALSVEQHETLAVAVRDTVRERVLELLRRRGPTATGELIECPNCGDRVIHLEAPRTFVFDAGRRERICSACGAVRDFISMERPDADIGGEGG